MSSSFCKVSACRYTFSHVTKGHKCGKCKLYGHGQIECVNDFLLKLLEDKSKDDILPYNKHCSIIGCKYKYLHSTSSHHCKYCDQNHSSLKCPLKVGILDKEYKLECPICKKENTIKHTFQKIYGCNNTCCICLDKNVEVFLPNCGHVCLCLECLQKINTNKHIDNDFKIYHESELPNHIIELVNNKFNIKNSKIYTNEYAGMGCVWYIRRDFKDGTLLGVFLHSDCQGQYGVNHIPYIDKFIEGYKLAL